MANDNDWAHFGNAIRHTRERCGLTLVELAARAELTPGDLAAIEDGACDVRLSTAMMLADGLGVPLGHLMEPSPENSAAALLAVRLNDEAPPAIQKAVLTILEGTAAKPDA
jgi:transcriptional regulator with XRE-family HTH domain